MIAARGIGIVVLAAVLVAPVALAAPAKSKQSSKKQSAGGSALLPKALEAAKAAGLPSCYVEVIMACESGGNAGVIGHDENALRSKTRPLFVKCGKKYSGATFTGYDAKNDDAHKLDPSKPDYGIDWRYSHGFGLAQVTSRNGTCDKPNEEQFCMVGGKRGLRVPDVAKGTCMAVPDLLTPEGGTKAMVLKLVDYYHRQAKGALNAANADVAKKTRYGVFYAHGTGHQPKHAKDWKVPWACLRTQLFQTCVEKGTLADDLAAATAKCHSWKKKQHAPIACDFE